MNLNLPHPLVYVTRDIERALGITPEGNYFVISNDTSYGRMVKNAHPKNVMLVGKGILDTYDLMLLPEVADFITKNKANVLVFQNTWRIEKLAKEKGWHLVNPSATLSKEIEEKISQTTWLSEDACLLPPFSIKKLKEISFAHKKFVIQFNHSHTGQGTHIIDSAESLFELQKKFPERECRVSDFIEGPVFTINVVVGEKILIGNPSYQITGLWPFTDLPFSTIGNDWALPLSKEYDSTHKDLISMARKIGERMKRSGWLGLFGIDAIFDPLSGKTYLLEINARQPASTTFESVIQGHSSIFEAHISSLLHFKFGDELPKIKGSQIVKRVTKEKQTMDISRLQEKKLSVIVYENTEKNKELFRIQSTEGIMSAHNKLGTLGNFIKSCILPA